MDVEQRHDAERNILGRQRVMGDDVPRGSGHVAMQNRHPLGTPGAAAGVKDQRGIVRRRRGRRFPAGSAGDPDESACVRLERIHRNAFRRGCAAGALRAIRRAKQDLGGRVFEVEIHLVFSIPGI